MRPYTRRGKAGHMAAQAAQQEGTGFICGKNAVAELLKSGAGADTVYSGHHGPARGGLLHGACKAGRGRGKSVRAQKLDAMCGTQSHQGVAARTASISYAQLPDILAAAAAAGQPPLLVLCDGVEDPHNLVPLCARRFCAARTAW